jgi:hypothetical protein
MQIRSVVPHFRALGHVGNRVGPGNNDCVGWTITTSVGMQREPVGGSESAGRHFVTVSARGTLEILRSWKTARMSPSECRNRLGPAELVKQVIHNRQRFPRWGKNKLVVHRRVRQLLGLQAI